MIFNKDLIDTVTKIINSKREGKRKLYLAKTTFSDGKQLFAEFAIGMSRQKAGE